MSAMAEDWATHAPTGLWDRSAAKVVIGVRIRNIRDPHRATPDPEADPSAYEAHRRQLGVWREASRRIAAAADAVSRLSAEFAPLDVGVWRHALATLREVHPPSVSLLPSVVPSHRGDLHLDWSLPDAIIEVQITPEGERHVLIETRSGREIYDGDFAGDGAKLIRKELDAAHFGG